MTQPEYGTDEWLHKVIRNVGIIAIVVTLETLALIIITVHAFTGWWPV